jgi:hypothetical protein
MNEMKKRQPLEVEMTPEAQASIEQLVAAHPEAEEAIRDFLAKMHQAAESVNSGQYASFEDAIEALTGERPTLIDLDED